MWGDIACQAALQRVQPSEQAAGKGDAAASLQLHAYIRLGGSKFIVEAVGRLALQGALQEL